MLQRLEVLPAIALAACAAPQPAPADRPISRGSACPAADRVVHAAWTAGGWKAITHTHPAEHHTAKGYEVLDAEQARAAGLTTTPTHVWVFEGSTPCRATVTRAFRFEYQYGFELEGCPEPAKPRMSVGLVGSEDFSECRWAVAHFNDETAVPAELTSMISARACDPPCERAVFVGRATAENTVLAYDVAQAWLAPHSDRCTTGDAFDVVVRGATGWMRVARSSDQNGAVLAGVFHDRGGARLVMLESYGTTDIYAVDRHTATRARHEVWFTDAGTRPFRSAIVPGCKAGD